MKAGRATDASPVAAVELTIAGRARTVYLKLEGRGPGGSVKERTARGLVGDLEARGVLRPGSVLVESTSGNLGVALAGLARTRGYDFLAVVDPKTTPENLARMRALGAEVELVDRPDAAGGYLLSRLARVRELCAASDRYVWPDQYENPANPLVHERETGPEIHRQLGGHVDAVVVAVSTGGTLAGIARFFRRSSPGTRLVAVDAVGSVALGGSPGPRLLTGIGAGRPSRFLAPGFYDERELVGDAEAFSACHALLSATGLELGGSSGAVLVAAARFLASDPGADRIVCLCADGGERYRSTVYSEEWLERNGVRLASAPVPIEAIAPVRSAHARAAA